MLWLAAALLAIACSPLAAVESADPFADEVVSFEQGQGGGFNAELLPDIVLGPPAGAGLTEGSTAVLSIGHGGQVTVAFTGTVICDGPGADFIVFENAFHSGSPSGPVFVEAGIVAVSQDGQSFLTFPYDSTTFVGLAGRSPVLSHPDNGIDPTDPAVAGGDAFDLAQVGLSSATFVRITDGGDEIADPGNMLPGGTVSGFDLDAVAAVHACTPGASVPTPTMTVVPTASRTEASTSTPSPTATPTPPSPRPGDLDESGTVDEADLVLLIAEMFDGDGDLASGEPDAADLNGDERINAADVTALVLHVSP